LDCDTSDERPVSPPQNIEFSCRQLSLNTHVAAGSRQLDGVTQRFSPEDVRQGGECPLPLRFCLPFSDARSLKFLNFALEPVRIYLSESIGRCTRKNANDQDFCRFIQLTYHRFQNAKISTPLERCVNPGFRQAGEPANCRLPRSGLRSRACPSGIPERHGSSLVVGCLGKTLNWPRP
jgi:hypothetical protein